MKAEKILHRNQIRIKIDFPYNQEFVKILKQISDAKWSQSHRAWHIPYTKEAFQQLKTLFPDVEYEITKCPSSEQTSKVLKTFEVSTSDLTGFKNQSGLDLKNSIRIEVIARKIIIKLPKNETDIKFINNL